MTGVQTCALPIFRDRETERELVLGKGRARSEDVKRLAELEAEIARAEGGDASVGPLQRKSATRTAHVVAAPDLEGEGLGFFGVDEAPKGGQVVPVGLPAWLPVETFLQDRLAWEWTWAAVQGQGRAGLGRGMTKGTGWGGPDAPEAVQRLVFGYVQAALAGEKGIDKFGLQ